MLEVSGETRRWTAIRSKTIAHPRVRETLQVPLRRLEVLRVAPEIGVGGYLLLIRWALHGGKDIRRHGIGEKRIVQDPRRHGVREQRGLARQRGGPLPGPMLFHEADQLIVYRPVSHAVGKAVDASRGQLLGILQREDVRHYFQSVAMCSLYDRRGDLDRNLGKFAPMVIHPDVDESRMAGGRLIDRRL